ncbi:het domain-containing protein [Fusarium pseudoanthophilum]|uniref:Het domain-containing protein n=1 Tax=Fusarium pseudoanthophilum TaxID=48495 RepID=A0A8H5KKE3_9HYPO|nr:het domain-containing protein [Fusarium pseudoanthophilum]
MSDTDRPLCYFCNLLTASSAQGSSASIYAEYELKDFDERLEDGEAADLAEKHCSLFHLVRDLYRTWQKGQVPPSGRYFYSCSPNSYDVTTLPDPSNNINDCQVAVFPDPLGSIATARITKWIDECVNNHEACQQENTEFFPTRLLDVGTEDTDVVKLVEPRQKVEYVALSHCWGQSNAFVTTRPTMKQMNKGFLLTPDVPKTFRDAVNVSRKFGVRYLWIDSLCIIQGDFADWEREASRMADVYRGAYFTIGAIAASDDREGFLKQRKSALWELKVFTATGRSIHVYLCPQDDKYINPHPIPLDKRGWTLQEQYLSRRMLRFSNYETTWTCQEKRYRELQHKDNRILDWYTITEITQPLKSYERVHKWYKMIHDYSRRKLSYDADRLPALSGLASFIARSRGAQYCAGMWWEDISYVLSWHATGGDMRPSSEYVAPSWSWASAFGSVTFPGQTHYHSHPAPMSSVKYLDVYLELKGHNLFGQLSCGWLHLQAVTVRLIKPIRLDTGQLRCHIEGIGDTFEAVTVFDLGHSQHEVQGIVLMRARVNEMAGKNRPEKLRLQGIIVRKAGEEDLSRFRNCKRLPRSERVFQRVGYFDVKLTTKEEKLILGNGVQDIVLI